MESKSEDDDPLWVARFGGSFNRIHAGHISIGSAAPFLDEYGFDRVVYVPTSDHYPKDGLLGPVLVRECGDRGKLPGAAGPSSGMFCRAVHRPT